MPPIEGLTFSDQDVWGIFKCGEDFWMSLSIGGCGTKWKIKDKLPSFPTKAKKSCELMREQSGKEMKAKVKNIEEELYVDSESSDDGGEEDKKVVQGQEGTR